MPKKKIEETNVTEELLAEQPENASDPVSDQETEVPATPTAQAEEPAASTPVRKTAPTSILTLNADNNPQQEEYYSISVLVKQ